MKNTKTCLALLMSCLSFNVFANVNHDEPSDWRTPKLDNLVYLEVQSGTVVIELAPFMAPNHVEQFKALVQSGFYDGLDFYRVIDGFVAQGGDASGKRPSKHKNPLKAEFSRTAPASSDFMLVQSPDFKAPQTGYLQGFAAGRDPKSGQEWLLHCPGTVAMGRNNQKDSASTEFYIVIGQATRHLDRNMSSFGRVIYGMPHVQRLNRAHINNASGVIKDPAPRSKIISIKLARDVPENERIDLQVLKQQTKRAKQRLNDARALKSDFFHFKGNGNLDLCYYGLKSRIVNPLAVNKPN